MTAATKEINIRIIHAEHDFPKAKLLAEALESCGYSNPMLGQTSVLPDAEPGIDDISNGANCIIVIWTRNSAADRSAVLQTVAEHAHAQGKLIPVMMQKTRLPLSFRNAPYVDLVGWKGAIDNVYFGDLLEACDKVAQGSTGENFKFAVKKRIPRVFLASLPIAAVAIGIGADIASVQGPLCSVAGMSDFCSVVGLGHLPTKEQRDIWKNLNKDSCQDLGAYIQEFPEGPYVEKANALLTVASLSETTVWAEKKKPIRASVGTPRSAYTTEELAQKASNALLEDRIESDCANYAASTEHRFVGFERGEVVFDCTSYSDGFRCKAKAEPTCNILVQTIMSCEK